MSIKHELPSAPNSESIVISSMMADNEGLTKGIEFLTKEDFYYLENMWLFEAIDSLFRKGLKIDLGSIINQLSKMKYLNRQGTKFYLDSVHVNEVGDIVMSSANIETHIAFLKEKTILRKLLKLCKKIETEIKKDEMSTNELLERSQKAILAIDSTMAKSLVSSTEAVTRSLSILENKDVNVSHGIGASIPALTNITGNFKSGQLIIIGAGTGHGKSLLTNQIIFSNIQRGKKGLIINMEMEVEEIIHRELSRASEVDHGRLESGMLRIEHIQKIHTVGSDLANKHFLIDDTATQTIASIKAKAMQAEQQLSNLDFIVIDYLQLITTTEKNKSREQEVAAISRGLKIIAKEFKCPVIALTQLNEEGKSRESRGIENDADKVIILERPYMAGFEKIELNGHEIPTPEDFGRIKVKKNRGGGLGQIDVRVTGALMKIEEWREDD